MNLNAATTETQILMTQKKAYLYLIIGTLIISFAPIFARLVQMQSDGFPAMDPTAAAFYRAIIGGVFLSLVLLLQGKPIFRVDKKVLLYLCIGALFFAIDMTAWYRSIVLVGPGLATLLASFQVFVLTIVGFLFLKEHPTLIQWFSIPVALLGLALIVGLDWSQIDASYKLGILLGLLTAVCYAAYILSLRGANKYELSQDKAANNPIRLMAVVSLIIAAILFLFTLGLDESFAVHRPVNWLWLILTGVFCQAIAWVFISLSLPFVRAAHVGMIILLQPIFAFVWDILFFDRGITQIELIGAVITVVAIYFGSVQIGTKKKVIAVDG